MNAIELLAMLATKIARGELPPDEPVFCLRAKDKTAAGTVRDWAVGAQINGAPLDKVDEAAAVADAMDRWPIKQVPGRDDTRTYRT